MMEKKVRQGIEMRITRRKKRKMKSNNIRKEDNSRMRRIRKGVVLVKMMGMRGKEETLRRKSLRCVIIRNEYVNNNLKEDVRAGKGLRENKNRRKEQKDIMVRVNKKKLKMVKKEIIKKKEKREEEEEKYNREIMKKMREKNKKIKEILMGIKGIWRKGIKRVIKKRGYLGKLEKEKDIKKRRYEKEIVKKYRRMKREIEIKKVRREIKKKKIEEYKIKRNRSYSLAKLKRRLKYEREKKGFKKGMHKEEQRKIVWRKYNIKGREECKRRMGSKNLEKVADKIGDVLKKREETLQKKKERREKLKRHKISNYFVKRLVLLGGYKKSKIKKLQKTRKSSVEINKRKEKIKNKRRKRKLKLINLKKWRSWEETSKNKMNKEEEKKEEIIKIRVRKTKVLKKRTKENRWRESINIIRNRKKEENRGVYKKKRIKNELRKQERSYWYSKKKDLKEKRRIIRKYVGDSKRKIKLRKQRGKKRGNRMRKKIKKKKRLRRKKRKNYKKRKMMGWVYREIKRGRGSRLQRERRVKVKIGEEKKRKKMDMIKLEEVIEDEDRSMISQRVSVRMSIINRESEKKKVEVRRLELCKLEEMKDNKLIKRLGKTRVLNRTREVLEWSRRWRKEKKNKNNIRGRDLENILGRGYKGLRESEMRKERGKKKKIINSMKTIRMLKDEVKELIIRKKEREKLLLGRWLSDRGKRLWGKGKIEVEEYEGIREIEGVAKTFTLACFENIKEDS